MKRGLFIMCISVLVVASRLQSVCAEEPSAQGTIKYGGKTLPLKSAVAWFNQKYSELDIDLFPVELTPAQMTEIQKSRMSIGVASKLPSPDPKAWAWCPHASLRIRFVRGSAALNTQTVSNYGLTLHFIEKEKESKSFSISAPGAAQDFKQLTVNTGTNGVVTLRVRNIEPVPAPGWEDAAYDFTLSAKLWEK